MIHKILYRLSKVSVIVGLACIGMAWMTVENVSGDRELALVRRQIPSVFINNETRDTARVGSSLYDGDTLRTDDQGYALVLFMDQSVTKVGPESQLIIRGRVNRNQSSYTRMDLRKGKVFLNVNREANSDVEVSTSQSVASVKGTEFGAHSSGYYWVQEGEVEVTARESRESTTITDRMYARISEDGMDIETGELTETELNSLLSSYRILDSDLIERTLGLRFVDDNGQIKEIELNYFEHEN